MDLTPFISTEPAVRRDGWSPERKLRFLDRLAACGNVRAACAGVGMSRDSAYTLRRRDALFARGWAAALLLAREMTVEVLGDRAIEGVEEDVWYRGELVGTRRRYDSRLLLAHIARLDRLAGEAAAETADDAARFDELLACVAGAEAPEEIKAEDEPLPLARETALDQAEDAARDCVEDQWADREGADENGELDDEQYAAYRDELEAEAERARTESGAQWDAWFEGACRSVDRALGGPADTPAPPSPGTPATTPAATAEACPRDPADSLRTVSDVPVSPGGARFTGPDGRLYARP